MRKHLFQRRFVCLRIQNTNMSTTTIMAQIYCYELEGICLFVCSFLFFACVLCRLCLVLAEKSTNKTVLLGTNTHSSRLLLIY